MCPSPHNASLYAKAAHAGRHWTSNIAANTYTPGVYGWTNHGPA